MQLTVLGCFGPYPPAGGACSGYLLRKGDFAVLLDCGNGVLSRLQEHLPFTDLDAIILSHLHADHFSDIMIMRYGLEMALRSGLRGSPLLLLAPPEPPGEFGRLPYKSAYTVKGVGCGDRLSIGPFTFSFHSGVHAVPSLVISVESAAGKLVYTGDTEYFRDLEEVAGGADIFLCEANYLQEDIGEGLPNHLSSAQAAAVAAAAGVKRLLLTHHHPARDRARSIAEASKHYPAAEIAVEGRTYCLSRP